MNDYQFIETVKLGVEANFDTHHKVDAVLVVLERAPGKEDAVRAGFIGQLPAPQLKQVLDDSKKKYPMMAMVLEGYTVHITKENDIDVMPWEHPQRRESIIVTVYSEGKASWMLVAPIVRPKGNAPFLAAWETNDIKSEKKMPSAEEDGK